jgi:protein SCO1/2
MSPWRRSACATIAVALSAVVAAQAAAATPPAKFDGPTIVHPAVAPEFSLRDQAGHVVRLADQRGKVTIVTFLYTHCPDACPLTAAHINAALTLLGHRRDDVAALAVSVDPKGDTPSAIRTFVHSHRLLPQFRYLTGTAAALERIWRLYNVTPVTESGPDPDHTLYVLLLDRTGKTRVLFDALAKPSAIAHDVGVLLGS